MRDCGKGNEGKIQPGPFCQVIALDEGGEVISFSQQDWHPCHVRRDKKPIRKDFCCLQERKGRREGRRPIVVSPSFLFEDLLTNVHQQRADIFLPPPPSGGVTSNFEALSTAGNLAAAPQRSANSSEDEPGERERTLIGIHWRGGSARQALYLDNNICWAADQARGSPTSYGEISQENGGRADSHDEINRSPRHEEIPEKV